MRSSTLFVLLSIAAVGCAGDPDRVGTGEADLGPPVPRAVWQSASPGCEDLGGTDLALAPVEGEPLLAALVDRDGHVACVDALSLLQVELGVDLTISPLAGDPSPQPAIQYFGNAEPISGSASLDAPTVIPDPKPIPLDERPILDTTPQLAHDDPTPTPIVED